MPRHIFLAGLVVSSVLNLATAADWPAFRGPHGNGWSDEKSAPTKWSSSENIRWKFKLPDEGNSSPIVVGDKVFVTCAQEQGAKRGLYCLNRADGKELWSQVVNFGRVMPTHKTNPYCAPTPASDGKHVVVWHATAGLYCYDMNGKELWKQDQGEFKHIWGYSCSPIIYKNTVIQNFAPGKASFIAAFDLDTGKQLWRTDEPTDGDGEKRADGAWMGCWNTPIVVKQDGADQVVCFQPKRVVAYNPTDGKIIWECGLKNHKGDLAYSSPIISDGVCVALGGFSGSGMAFKLGGTGDLGEKAQLWYKKSNPQSIGTGVIISGYLYVPDAGPNTIRCIEVATGKEMWADRTSGGAHWGSIVMVGDKAYVTNQSGTTVIFKPNPEKFELVAKNELGEHSDSTPAVSNGEIFIRTYGHLYCIAEK